MTLREPISRGWVATSYLVFIGCEVALGGLLQPLVRGFISQPLHLRLQVVLLLGSYLIGGFVVGLLSPRVRLLEPAIAAALAVVTSFLFSVFTPVRFYALSADRMLLGGAIAFGIALVGADAGERLAARLGNRDSQRWAGK